MQTARPLRIAVVSKSDAGDGGAGRVAEESVRWLNDAGHTATHFVAFSKDRGDQGHGVYWTGGRPGRWLCRMQKNAGLLDFLPFELPKLWWCIVGRYDVAHFHNLSGTMSPLSIRALAAKLPVIWTFHDFSPFTGGCLYPMHCTKFESRCTDCPSTSWPLDTRLKFTAFLQHLRSYAHAHPNVTCTVPIKWLADMAIKAAVIQIAPRVVSNRIDLAAFRATAKPDARRALGINAASKLVLLSANSLGDPRKGAREGVAALSSLRGTRPGVLLMGNPDPALESALQGFDVHSFGYVRDPARQALIYSAADAFVFPTLAEVQSLAVIESLACGTPVLGFASGGIPGLVDSGRTGILVPVRDVEGLRRAIDTFLADVTTAWSENCIAASRRFDKADFVSDFVALYRDAIARFKPGPG